MAAKTHKHAELIKAWADGAEIQRQRADNTWESTVNPSWGINYVYRIKPRKLTVGMYYPVIIQDVRMVLHAVTRTAMADAHTDYSVDDCDFIGEAISVNFG